MGRSIKVELTKLESTAAKIDQQVAEYERIYKSLFNEVDGMGAAWQGQDNLTFVNQIKGFKDDFQQMTQLIKQYSKFLKTSAKLYRNTQNEIVSAAKSLIN